MLKNLFNKIFKRKLKYLVIGAGSTGATFACFLKSANKDVTLISKYDSVIKAIKDNGGIKLKSEVKGEKRYKINIKTESQYKGHPDVIILCIRTPDILSAVPLIERVSKKNTVVFSISNGFGIGYALHRKLKNVLIAESTFVGKCRWYNRENAEYLQLREYCELRLSDKYNSIDKNLLSQIRDDFKESGMDSEIISDNQFSELAFERLITRSPFEACCIYYNISANEIVGEKRILFENLCNELLILAKAMNINVRDGFLDEYYSNFEKYKERDDANVYSSILNDMNIGQSSEIDFLFFIVVELAKEYKTELPNYFMIAEKFKEYNTLTQYK